MKIKILKILVVIWINIFFISCTNTKIIWTDFRNNPTEERIEISFLNNKNKSIKNVSFISGKTRFAKIPYDCIPHGFSRPDNLSFNYLIDYNNKVIEFFLMDIETYNVEHYNAVLEKKENVYAYSIMFHDELEKKKLCTIFSKDNVFTINKEDILPSSTLKTLTQLLEQLTKSDAGYFFEIDALNQIENFQKSYLVKGNVFNHFFWISPNTPGIINYYIPDETLPDWLKTNLQL